MDVDGQTDSKHQNTLRKQNQDMKSSRSHISTQPDPRPNSSLSYFRTPRTNQTQTSSSHPSKQKLINSCSSLLLIVLWWLVQLLDFRTGSCRGGALRLTCREASAGQPGVLQVSAVQQVVSLQEAVQRAEDDGGADDLQRNRPSAGQQGVDAAPAEPEQSSFRTSPPKLSETQNINKKNNP